MFARDNGTLTDHNEVANEQEARKRERAKYHFPSAQSYRERIAASFLQGRYVLPSGLDREGDQQQYGENKENPANLTSKQNTDCQTEVATTRDVGLGDGDIDALPPERTIDIASGLPDVGEFPILSLPQQLEAEKRLQGLLARVEEEINRVAEEARREAAKNTAKNPTQAAKSSSDTFLNNDEWNSRMMSAVTNRLRGKHQQFDEDLALSQATYLQTFVRQHKIGLKAEEGTRRYDVPNSSKWVHVQEEPQVISQTITPAVQHVLKMKPMLGAGIHYDPSQQEEMEEDITTPASIANRAAQRKAEAARPLTRGLRIALSKQRYYTTKPGQRDVSPGAASGLPQMGRKSASGDELMAPSSATLKEASPEVRTLGRQKRASSSTNQPIEYGGSRSLRDSHGIPSPRR